MYPNSFTQWSGDNVDHDVVTLDGTGTFHGMAVISVSTPCCAHDPELHSIVHGNFNELAVTRLTRVRALDKIHNRGIPIIFYT